MRHKLVVSFDDSASLSSSSSSYKYTMLVTNLSGSPSAHVRFERGVFAMEVVERDPREISHGTLSVSSYVLYSVFAAGSNRCRARHRERHRLLVFLLECLWSFFRPMMALLFLV